MESPSSRRAWIEIFSELTPMAHKTRSPSSRRAWIEIPLHKSILRVLVSPSSRRAWIEIIRRRLAARMRAVALLAEGVDRNISVPSFPSAAAVAHHPAGGDFKKKKQKRGDKREKVAHHAEGVDRNFCKLLPKDFCCCRPPRGGRG